MNATKKKKRPNLNRARNMDVDAWRERQIEKRLNDILQQREQDFITQHAEDTDAQLLAYLRGKAEDLRRMPHPLELPGAQYLQQRLGDWGVLAMRLGYRPAGYKKGQLAYQKLKEQATQQFIWDRKQRKIQKQLKKSAKYRQEAHPSASGNQT
ncbi:MAG: hypothetical protein K6B40_07200 [Firmicutes bacterium]|nr:hypothetical protein [Bacillota bacterium]